MGVLKEEAERVENLPYTWQKLRAQSADVQDLLQEIHPHFHQNLLEEIKQFHADCEVYYVDYATVTNYFFFQSYAFGNCFGKWE